MFGSAVLGTALHQTLAKVHGHWHYRDSRPSKNWIYDCWYQHAADLTTGQINEGLEILGNYYDQFIATQAALNKPMAVEGRIQATLLVHHIEFMICGRYDRIDYLADGLELIDYKSGREVKRPNPEEVNLQLGLYCLALEQRYQKSLKRMSLIYLRTGERVSFEVTAEHRQRVEAVIEELALEIRETGPWQPKPTAQCSRCTYLRYCPSQQNNPLPLPVGAKPERRLQLTLAI